MKEFKRNNENTITLLLNDAEIKNIQYAFENAYYCYAKNDIFYDDGINNCNCFDEHFHDLKNDIENNNYGIHFDDIKNDMKEYLENNIIDSLEHYTLIDDSIIWLDGIFINLQLGFITLFDKKDISKFDILIRLFDKLDLESLESNNYQKLQNANNK